MEATSDIDALATGLAEEDFARRKALMEQLKLRVVELLRVYEQGAPKSNLPRILHILIHVPDAIYRWNSVRNMWCFFNER